MARSMFALSLAFAQPLAHMRAVPAASIASASAAALFPYRHGRTDAVHMVEDEDFDYDRDWAKRIFTPENAGPWLILITVLGLEVYNAAVPVEDMPPLLQQIIPTVLGSQYQRPPGA